MPLIEVIRLEIIYLWTKPPKIYITKGTEVGKLKYNQIVQKAKNNLGHILVYIDGSKIKGEVGALVYILKLKTKAANYIGMNQVSTVYVGELKGLQLALNLVFKYLLLIRRLIIFIDNQVVI